MLKLAFNEVFERLSNGTITPRRAINVNGITFGPGIAFGPGVSFGGINFFDYQHLSIAADDVDGILIIRGFYKN